MMARCSSCLLYTSPKREKQVDFTDSYYMDDQAIVTMKDNADITGDNYADALNVEGVKLSLIHICKVFRLRAARGPCISEVPC